MSRQQDHYLAARAAEKPVDEACALAGIPASEAVLIEKDIARGAIALPPLDHNQSKEDPMTESVAADELRLLIERVERLEEEKRALSDDIKDVYSEAKSRGYDTKTMRRIVALRKMETHVREEAQALLETYASALGIQGVLI